MGLDVGLKGRIAMVLGVIKGVFHIAFMPTILYLGFSQGAGPGMPPLTLLNLLWQ
ncbi:translocase of outer membrane subunit tom7, putative [Pediculus humanus corporis]|uniref:Mitochondrial import receptor subunit TOM7 homolog n=1 Tax=Pediculus humanus subsp. corporis TaxID=121224 RepID=E0VJA3_PEDHC|nr:translocase of outer membrane subunit tom7, putative [Pediculus humanus corporis]EEB13459.1 translocase of outer membrane subunit tom7, putative [Pediculus humanus corporis]